LNKDISSPQVKPKSPNRPHNPPPIKKVYKKIVKKVISKQPKDLIQKKKPLPSYVRVSNYNNSESTDSDTDEDNNETKVSSS
ncbi:hypothetical protein ABTN19_19685, partial [Acinetobacter baumannii]